MTAQNIGAATAQADGTNREIGAVIQPQKTAERVAEWRDYLPAGLSRERAVATSWFLTSQRYYFERLGEAGQTDHLAALIGKDWREPLLRGIARAFAKHPIHDMVGVQPATQPVCGVHYLVRSDDDGLPRLSPETKSVETAPRKIGYLNDLPTPEVWGDVEIAELVFQLALDEVAVGVAETVAQAVPLREPDAVERLGNVVGQDPIDWERQRVWERSGREPNVLLGHTSCPVHRHRASFVGWPQLPQNRVMMLRKDGAFGSVVWAPFVFQIAHNIDPNLFRRRAALLIRHAVRITDSESIGVAWLEGKAA